MAGSVAAPLWAEESGKDTGQQGDETVLQLEPVLVTGRAADLLGSAGSASQGQVGQTELDTRLLLRPGEVLEVIPGMAVTQHSGTGKANQYFLRGFNLDHGTDFSTRIDGMPVNLPTHGHGQGYMDLNFLIPEIIDTVDFRYRQFLAQLDVLNLCNSKDHDIDYFYASRLPGEPAEGVADVHFHPIEPRTVRFYLTYKF